MKTKRRGFEVYDEGSAPVESREFLKATKVEFGMIPNLEGVMAEAPVLLEGYGVLWKAFGRSSLSAVEQQVVLQAVNVRHGCDY